MIRDGVENQSLDCFNDTCPCFFNKKKVMDRKDKNSKPVTVHITNHNKFEKGVGAFITNLNHLTIVMDSEGNMKMDASQVPVMPHTEVDKEKEKPDLDDEWIVECIKKLKEEKALKRLFDYTWVMEVMNQTKGLPKFNTPSSFKVHMAFSPQKPPITLPGKSVAVALS